MAKRVGLIGAAIALAALTVGAVGPALGASGDDDETRTIRLTSTTEEENFLDLGDEGPSLGDQFVFSSKLLKGDNEVGHSGIACTATSVEREEFQCVGTLWLRGGQITVQALVDGSPEFVVPVTGGSEKYEGASGEMHVRRVSETEEFLVLHLED